jgi:hypothetical protein
MIVSVAGNRTITAVRRFSLVFMLVALWAGHLAAQQVPDPDIAPPPPSGFSDKDGVLGRNPEIQRRITGLVQDLKREHGYRLYVILERALISASPNDLAAKLQQEWLPDGGGLVIVFELDTRSMGFGRGFDPGEGLIDSEAGVPAYELVAAVSKALSAAEKAETTELFLETAITGITTNIREYFERKKAPPESGRSFKLMLVAIGGLSLFALCVMALGWFMGKADRKQSLKRSFPPVDVPERLSAPYGGGGGGYARFGGGGP